MPWTPPNSAKSYPVRPLDKGMVRNLSGQHIPESAFTTLKEFIATKRGPRRYSGMSPFAGSDTVPYRMQDYLTIWQSDGLQRNVLLTDKALFKVNPFTGFTEAAWTYSTGTVSISGASVTGSGTAWTTADIYPGDIFRVGADEGVVSSVSSNTALVLEAATIPNQSGVAYSIQRAFGPGFNPFYDAIVAEDTLIVTDGKRPLLAYDPTAGTFSYWMATTGKMPLGVPIVAGCIAYYDDRVWIGDTQNSVDGRKKQRIYWSALADKTNFSITTSYMDIPYTSGALLRLMPMGSYLMAYFRDAIFIGALTNYPLAPVKFTQFVSGGIGLVGQKAITSFRGGHVFVGQDGIYLASAGQIQPLACPVFDDMMENCSYPDYIRVTLDPVNKCILFGIPAASKEIARIWAWSYDCDGWSYLDLQTDMIANPLISATMTIDALTGTIDGLDGTYPTINTMGMDETERSVFFEHAGSLWKATEDGTEYFGASQIAGEIITRDFDFGAPDDLKAFLRLGLKVDFSGEPTTVTNFAIYGSTTRGRTWKYLGNVRIGVGQDEGYANFRISGSTCRFKITCADAIQAYVVSEMTLRVRTSGSDESLGSQE